MAIELNPAPVDLGLSSPSIGPWFSDAGLILPQPGDDLAVTITFGQETDWLPPANGLLSLFISTPERPLGLAGLRQASGDPAFADNRLIGLFRLLPPAEERLDALTAGIPSADGSGVANVSTRPRVRYIALELPNQPPLLNDLGNLVDPPIPPFSDVPVLDQRKAKAEHVGLTVGEDDDVLGNADAPMSDLKRPGILPGLTFSDRLLIVPGGVTARLWAFDANGRAIDPGAVAAWWRFLGIVAFTNLFAPGDQRTVNVEPGLHVHLVNAHEGPFPADDPVLARLLTTNVSPIGGGGPVRQLDDANAGAQFSFDVPPAAPDPDPAPFPRMALLPNGSYGSTLGLWPAGPLDALLVRDFVRVAVVDVEHHLLGQRRVSTEAADTPAGRRAADQDRISTRVLVGPVASGALLTTVDDVTDAAINLFSSNDPVRLATSVLDRDWGGLDPLDATTLPAVAPPESLPEVVASPLVGGGTVENNGTIIGQRVLLQLALESGLAGAWVRAWTQGLDPETGLRFRLDGGGGLVRADGNVSLVVPLADGTVFPDAQMGVDMEVVTGVGTRLYMDQRFVRPIAVGGVPLPVSNVNQLVTVCETGQQFQTPVLVTDVPSGATLIAQSAGASSLLDKSTLPVTAFRIDTLIRGLSAGDAVTLTQPAYRREPDGDGVAVLSATGATVERLERQGLAATLQPGAPVPTMERLEVVAARVGAAEAQAVIASAPALGRFHELLPHQSGHPGAPASVEVHGTGVLLNGPGAIGAAAAARDRVFRSTGDLIRETIARPFVTPAPPASPTLFAAVLRTVAAGVEGEQPALAELLFTAVGPFLFSQTVERIEEELTSRGITIPPNLSELADDIARAFDRRLTVAARGAREGATSLVAALSRAEDLIYIETPALDDTALGVQDDVLELWKALKDRVGERKALRVLLCVPIRMMSGTPAPLSRVRDALLLDAIASLKAAAGPTADRRIVVISPGAGPGRTLRLTSTTVIVDDAYALTGTTHLWRRGLSFDSSLAVSVFDERLEAGRPAEIRRFRRELVAGRLNLRADLVPDDPAELLTAAALLVNRGGGGRLATEALATPDPNPSSFDCDAWNRDGSPLDAFDAVSWLTQLTADVQAQIAEEVSPAP